MKAVKMLFILLPMCLIMLHTYVSDGYAANTNVTDYGDGTCSDTNISAAISDSLSGDAVIVPAGTCTWTDSVTIPEDKTIKLIGAGSTKTIISYSNTMIKSLSSSSRISGFRFNLTSNNTPIADVKNTGWLMDGPVEIR